MSVYSILPKMYVQRRVVDENFKYSTCYPASTHFISTETETNFLLIALLGRKSFTIYMAAVFFIGKERKNDWEVASTKRSYILIYTAVLSSGIEIA